MYYDKFIYWLQRSNNVRDGYKWIYNSYREWQEQFTFWSNATLRRVINSLEKQGLLITANYNKAGFDKAKWYRINYKQLDMSQRLDQFAQMDWIKMNQPIPIDYQRLLQRLTRYIVELTHDHAPLKKIFKRLLIISMKKQTSTLKQPALKLSN